MSSSLSGTAPRLVCPGVLMYNASPSLRRVSAQSPITKHSVIPVASHTQCLRPRVPFEGMLMSFVFVLTKKYTMCTKSSYKTPGDAWGETKARWFVLVFATTNSFKGVLMDNVFALAVKNTRSTESSYIATNELGDASKYPRQCGACWRFQPRSPSKVCSGTMASFS